MKSDRKKAIGRRSRLSLRDLFFISFGGQAPFISLLTFGTVIISLVGVEGVIAMAIATLVVLSNGLVVYFLSKRFKRGGGYYVYAFYSLTFRLGLNTGWNYILYSLSYGGTLLTGGAYVLYIILNNYFSREVPPLLLNQWFLTLLVSLLASSLVIAGVKVSARYAMVISLIEMVALIFLSLFFFYNSKWNFYNPIPSSFSPSLSEAVVFALGIPTGYGSITPLGEEARSTEIGKAAIYVLLLGGALASLFFYSLGSLNFTGNLPYYLLSRFGIVGLLIPSFISLNDGVLGGMTYVLANSRTIKAMAEDKVLPYFLSKIKLGKPLFSELFISSIFILSLTLITYYVGLFNAFTFLGALAGLNNLFIHISASMSLVRVASKRSRKHLHEIIIGLFATAFSLFVFFYSLPTFNKYDVYFFMGWIILGFLYAEVLEILKTSQNE